MKNKIKRGIDEYIGHEKIFTSETKNRIMNEIGQSHKFSKSKTSVFDFIRLSINSIVVILVLSLLTFWVLNTERSSSNVQKETEELREQISRLENDLEKERIQGNEEEVKVEEIMTNEFPALSQAELTNLGFKGTVDDIKADLIQHEDIIPYEGVLGGDMHFLSDNILVLSHEWVFAPFDDGHTGGYLLLNFEINDGAIEQWKVLDSYLYGEND